MVEPVRLKVDVADGTKRLRITVVKLFNMALFGLNAPPQNMSALVFPNTRVVLSFKFPESEDWNDDIVLDEFRFWVLANAFREVAEAIHAMLEDVYALVLSIRLAEQVSTKGSVTSDALLSRNGERVQKIGKFKRGGLVDKLKELKKIGFLFEAEMETHIANLLTARNCLTHREGIVEEGHNSTLHE